MSHTLEEWRPIAGLEGRYKVSNLGRVRSLTRVEIHIRRGKPVICRLFGRVLKPGTTKNGYLVVNVGPTGKQKAHAIHSLVADAFLPTCPGQRGRGGWHVDHINEDKHDNRAENLRWLTHRENNSTATVKARHRARPRNALGNRFISRTDSQKPPGIVSVD